VKLKTYSDFLLESVLYTSDEFKKVLSSMNDETARHLLSLIDKDIKTNYNILKTTDANDTISFIPDNQAITKLKSINLPALFLSKANTTSIGRICRSILNDNGISKTDKEMEIFVNGFKAAYDKINTKEDSIRIVSGEDIRYWYFEERYCDATRRSRGSLGKSCMRYDEAQDYLNIYVKNPDVCKLVIQVDEGNKLLSRALLWETTNNSLYLDRVYYTNDSDNQLLASWTKEKFKDRNVIFIGTREKLEVKLGPILDYVQYPYMDSFVYFYAGEQKLYNYDPDKVERKKLFYLQETDGSADRQDNRFCEYIEETWPEDDCVWCEKIHSYLPKHMAVWSEYCNSFLYRENAVQSTIINDYLDSQDSIYVYMDSNGRTGVWYPDDSKYRGEYEQDEMSGEFYIKDLLIQHNGSYYLRDKSVFVYSILEESEAEYEKIYHSKSFISSELDNKVFGFKLSEDFDVESKYNFYRNVYKNVKYKEFMEKLNSLEGIDKKYIDLKITELNDADAVLRRGTDFYKINNILYEEFDTDPIQIMKEYRRNIESGFDESFDFLKNRIGWPDVIKYRDEIKYFSLNPIINDRYLSNFSRNEFPIVKEKLLEKNSGMSLEEQHQIAHSIVGTCERIVSRILSTEYGYIIYYYLTHTNQFKQ
jgi:hypothetical protein